MAKRTKSDQADETAKTNKDAVTHWISEIDLAKKREKLYRKEGQRIIDIYAGKKIPETPFNILFSNTETLLPAVYSQVPRPVVQRRFKDADPIGKAGAEAGTRGLEFLLDTNIDGYETFNDGMAAATLDALLPGRGVTCIKYDAETDTLNTEPADAGEGGDKTEAETEEEAAPDLYKKSELVCLDTKIWNRVFFGYSKKWSTTPWIAYEIDIDEEESERLFGHEITAKLTFTCQVPDKNEENSHQNEENKGDKKLLTIYQIWDKDGGRKVRYVTSQYKDNYLKVEEDPLELTGFFNCPKPLQFVEKNDRLPVALYALYENQAKELNDITRRINLTIKAIKAKAIYDTSLGDDLKKLVEAEDNDWVPADNASSLAAEKGLGNAIWYMPIEQLTNVLQILVASRDQCKQVIYEITGISDILRGATAPSETATAQKIKSQWGSLRLKRLQKEVQRYARDLLRMMLEVAATKFNEETWAKMTGLPYLTEAKFAELQSLQQAMGAELQQAKSMAPPPVPGQPPAPPPPQIQQLMQQYDDVQKQLQIPQWSQVLGMLRDDMQRAYRIDIETNSTVEAEATEDKEKMGEVMAAMGQALNGLTPLVANGTLPFQAAQAMLLTIVRRFRFGGDVEDMIKAMKPPQPPEDGKAKAAQAQMQLEQQKMQQEAQSRQAEAAFREKESQQTAMQAQAKMQSDKEQEIARLVAQQQLEAEKQRGETEREAMRIEAEKRAGQAKLTAERVMAREKAQIDKETELEKTAMLVAGQLEVARISAANKPVAQK